MSIYIQTAISSSIESPDFQSGSGIPELLVSIRKSIIDDDEFLIRTDDPYSDLVEQTISKTKGSCRIIDDVARYWDGAHGIIIERDPRDPSKKKTLSFPITKWVYMADRLSLSIILELIDITKVCPLLLHDIQNKTMHDFEGVEDIRRLFKPPRGPYLGPDDILPEGTKDELLKTYVQSDEVVSYLSEEPLTKRQAITLILGADRILSEKLFTIQQFKRFDNSYHELIDEVMRKPTGFSAQSSWDRVARWSFVKWSKKLERIVAEGKGNDTYVKGYGNLLEGTAYCDVPLPYQPGDIVALDCRPYGESSNGLVLYDGNGSATAPILYRSEPGRYAMSRINIGRNWGDNHDALSPIYRMCKQAHLPVEDYPLSRLSEVIGGDQTVAKQLWSILVRNNLEHEIPESLWSSFIKASIDQTGDLNITFFEKTNPGTNYIAAFKFGGSAWMHLTPMIRRPEETVDPKGAGRWSLTWNGFPGSDTRTVNEYDKRICSIIQGNSPTYAVMLAGNGTNQLSANLFTPGLGWTAPAIASNAAQIDIGSISTRAGIYDISTGEQVPEQRSFNVELRCDDAPTQSSLLWFSGYLTIDVYLYAYEGDIDDLIEYPKSWAVDSSKSLTSLNPERGFRDLSAQGAIQIPVLVAHDGHFAFAANTLDKSGQSTIKLQASSKPFLNAGSIEVA